MRLKALVSAFAFVTSFSSPLRALSTIQIDSNGMMSGSAHSSNQTNHTPTIDPEYPGTAVERMMNIRERTRNLTGEELSQDWEEVRVRVLTAGGLKNLQSVRPGEGYTGHSFNDYNHCDLTAMSFANAHNRNEGRVTGIAFDNPLGRGILAASLPDLGAGGSWSTCMNGCNQEPPADVAHVQFQSRIAFKLVWCPPKFSSFVLVDDAGQLLNKGTPTGKLPHISERQQNYFAVKGSKYAVEAEKFGVA
jgi:hypothetical protein